MYQLLLILFISPIALLAQSNIELGIGIITVKNLDALPTIKFYSDTTHKIPAKQISVLKDKQEELVLKNAKLNAWLAPEGLWLDYYIFIFRCTKKRGKWCEVYVNNDRKIKYWIELHPGLQYQNWRTFLLTQSTSVVKRDEYNLEVKESPNDTSKRIKMMEKGDCFIILELKGDWIKVKTNDVLECSESRHPVKSGWIRWKKNNRLLIEYGLAC